jgi:hypothetical protein
VFILCSGVGVAWPTFCLDPRRRAINGETRTQNKCGRALRANNSEPARKRCGRCRACLVMTSDIGSKRTRRTRGLMSAYRGEPDSTRTWSQRRLMTQNRHR